MHGIQLLQLGQLFMYSFSTANLPSKFDSFFLLIIIFMVIIQGTLSFFGHPSTGQTLGSFLYPFKTLHFSIPLISTEIENTL